MLYRFREAQAAELGLGTRADRRPKMASACKSLRECERWRGEILREISRKVSKIQDAGLSDYEVRDVNDDINKLLREKRHWENQIVSLGGANYRRNVPMIDEDGKEVPGTKGYKYFGRAKELPGVKELFASKKKDEEEENLAANYYKKFLNHGPAYYGDLDEADGKLLEFEMEAEERDWAEAYTRLRESLGLDAEEPIPKLNRFQQGQGTLLASDSSIPDSADDATKPKRKQPPDGDVEMTEGGNGASSSSATPEETSKRPKKDGGVPGQPASTPHPATSVDVNGDSPVAVHARAAAAYIPFLTAEMLMPPKMPTVEEMEGVLLDLRKRALVDEYFGDQPGS
ncbi:pre-mRNA-splicing factor ISY1 [Thelephora terrestris]|uniref:Pre-mRNA-splicing factor ISY1 n=1 Tax=Thelephora terrestris TaxID=56493 RepID=A0A9P6L3M5_9AGAM|nr:pre-mRNA-splicing factor ISY1 [Thelephora terrestris]